MNINDIVAQAVVLCGPGFDESDTVHVVCQLHASAAEVYGAWRRGADLSQIRWVTSDGRDLPPGRGVPDGPALDLADGVLDALVFIREALGLNPDKVLRLAMRRRMGERQEDGPEEYEFDETNASASEPAADSTEEGGGPEVP